MRAAAEIGVPICLKLQPEAGGASSKSHLQNPRVCSSRSGAVHTRFALYKLQQWQKRQLTRQQSGSIKPDIH